VAIKDKPVDDMELSIETKNGIARLKGRMGVLFESEVRFDDKRFFARVDMDGFDPGPYFTAAGQDSLSGRLNGSITANGRLDDLPITRVRADLKNSSLGFNRDELITIPSLTLSLTDGRFSIPESGITILGEEKITIKGDGELKGGIHFELKGMIPFKAAAPVFDTVSDASGDIMVWALMEGTLSEPSLTASLTLERLGMSVSGIEQKFKDIDGTIKITPDRIHILQFTGGLDDGRFDLSGNIGLNKLKPDTYHLSFNARQLFLEFPDLMDIHLNADLSLSGDTDRSDLKGEIVVIEGRYFKKIELDLTDVAAKKREIQPIQEKPDTPFLKKMALNIDIRHREPFWVDNNLALLSVLPDLKLAGTAADPLITGRARVDSGTITFQKKEFDIKKGIIDFINPYKIEPLIDMEATLDVRSWTLYLTVSGTPDNLDFNFSSIPQEQHADILSLLAFGKTTRELRRADGGSAFSPDAILAEFVTGMLQENIKEASGIDTLEIKPDHLDNNGTPGINVVVGKELSRQMTVKYGVDVRNGETVQRMTTDYKLLENLLMRGFQDTGGHFGGELTYRLEFR
jgi:translocation and assembly module TamB